jgi:ferredoxin
VLGIDDDASAAEVKSAYRSLTKVCHPDLTGDEDGHNMCILLNEAYDVLMDPEQRRQYNRALDEALEDEVDGFRGEPLSKWMANTRMGRNADPAESRAVFVDELACIGCKQCVWSAPATFRMEDEHGRSRAFAQWLNTEDELQEAMEACPVSCIHWVEREDLAALEFVSRHKVARVGVGSMMSGQGGAVADVWDATARYLKDREERRKKRERAAKYSAAAAAARAAAAQELARRQAGWFGAVAEALGVADAARRVQDAVNDSVGASSSEDEYAAYQRVGRRARARGRKDPAGYGARGANGGRVPADRALVLAGAGRRVWER